MRKLLRRPSSAMVVACLALFVASTGTSIAASHYLITSTKQIKPSVLTKLKGNRGPRGYQGLEGATGAAGATNVVAYWQIGTSSGASTASVEADCPSGQVATGGGVAGIPGVLFGTYPVVQSSYPIMNETTHVPYGWKGILQSTGSGAIAQVYVICASP